MTGHLVEFEHPLLLSDAPAEVLAAWREDLHRRSRFELWAPSDPELLRLTQDAAALRAAIPGQRDASP